jgi:hypothetical protein
MTFELAQRQSPNIDNPDLITLLALAWLLFLDCMSISRPWIVRRQIDILVAYDRGCKIVRSEIDTCNIVYQVGRSFLSFSLVFVLIDLLEGVLRWLQ